MRRISMRACRTLVGALALAVVAVSPAWGQAPVPVINSSVVPTDVSIPAGFPGNPIAFFDDYSWRTFIALVWPGEKNQRGVPDTTKTVDGAGPRVFETYKSLEEVFHVDGSAPTAFNAFDPPKYNPCGVQKAWGDLTLGSFSKFSNLDQAGFGFLVGPLISQNKNYVRFLTLYNQTEFNEILTKQWYVRANLPATLTFPFGSIDVKSSWIIMQNVRRPERFYTRPATVLDPVTGNCSTKTVGLVGLHIVQKTPSRPQWIWTTFEQVDNLFSEQFVQGQGKPPFLGGFVNDATFNFGPFDKTPMPSTNPYHLNRVLTPPTAAPFNVVRVKPIHTSTQATNAAYHAALKNADSSSVWQFYQLVMTQWPVAPNSPSTPGTPMNTFPGLSPNDATAFANATMETFDQGDINTGCMSCHSTTQVHTDFVWSLNDHAFPIIAGSTTPDIIMRNPPFRALRALLDAAKEQKAKRAGAGAKNPK